LDRGQLQTARRLLQDLPAFEEGRVLAAALEGPTPVLDPKLPSSIHRNATAVRAFRMLEDNDLVQAEQIAAIAHAEAGSGLGRLEFLAAELGGAGSQVAWVRQTCHMLAFADERRGWPLIAGATATPSGGALMNRFLAEAQRDGWTGQLVTIGRALWLSRSGDGPAAIAALEAAPAVAQLPAHAAEVTEILARPIWYQLLGLTTNVARSALEPGDERCRKYLETLVAGDLATAVGLAAQQYEQNPGAWIWGLTLVWDAAYAGDTTASAALVEQLTYKARFNCSGLWAMREARRTAGR
jgi:hypothetical protein